MTSGRSSRVRGRFKAAGSLATLRLNEIAGSYVAAVAPKRVAEESGDVADVEVWDGDRPQESAAAWRSPSREALGGLLRRLAILGRVLPDQLLQQYNAVIDAEIEKALAESPLERTVEVRQRVGQDLYRKALMQYWNGLCAISGLSIPLFLRASHAKPWRDATDRERLDVHNGLLLAAHLDIAFDQGFLSGRGRWKSTRVHEAAGARARRTGRGCAAARRGVVSGSLAVPAMAP